MLCLDVFLPTAIFKGIENNVLWKQWHLVGEKKKKSNLGVFIYFLSPCGERGAQGKYVR